MKNLKDEIEDKAYREILELKDVDEMFDSLIASAYFRGRFDGMLPVDESRLVFKKIKSLLVEQEKESLVKDIVRFLDELELRQPDYAEKDNWRCWKYIRNNVREQYLAESREE